MKTNKENYYRYGGIQVDVSQFLNQPSDCLVCTNLVTGDAGFGTKEVRPGYTTWLDKPDNSSVRNLYYYDIPDETGVFRVSDQTLYKYIGSGTASWGSQQQAFTVDVKEAFATLAGSVPFVHLSNATDGYATYNRTTGFTDHSADTYTPASTFLTAWQSRIFGDFNKLLLYESAVSFDLNTGYTTEPFTINANDPAGGGSTPVNSGADGEIVEITSSSDRVHIFKNTGVYRYNGQSFMRYPFRGHILSVCTTDNDVDYFMTPSGIFKCDGKQVSPASFGVNKIIRQTAKTYGLADIISYSVDNYTYFFIGTMNASPSAEQPLTLSNAMFVHDEALDEWYIWSLGHQMTAFGKWLNPTTKRLQLISGDVDGNTYIWGDEYYSDNGTPIHYHLRGAYMAFGDPDKIKYLEQYSISMKNGQTSSLNFALDYKDEYKNEQIFAPKILNKDKSNRISAFNAISLEVMGSASQNRPVIYGTSISYQGGDDESDRREDSKKARR